MRRRETATQRLKREHSSSRAMKVREGFSERLAVYAAAAGAAGVGLLATAQPASADIVYTPANIGFGGDYFSVFIDINHNGHNDLRLFDRLITGAHYLEVSGYGGARALLNGTSKLPRYTKAPQSGGAPDSSLLSGSC